MARPKKEGLDYFPVDVTFDEKIDAIESMHGNNGIVWILRFWQKAYKTMTGLVDFRGLFAELFANKCRITIEEHRKILDTSILVEFCHEVEPGVYTSNGIQKRISSVSKDRKDAIERQNKEKKKKVKKSKVKDCPNYSANNSESNIEDPLWVELSENGFNEYIKMAEPEWDRLQNDWSFIERMKVRLPFTNIRESMEAAWEDYWGVKLGWENKRQAYLKSKKDAKKKGIEFKYEIDWEGTIRRNLDKSRVKISYNTPDVEQQHIDMMRRRDAQE